MVIFSSAEDRNALEVVERMTKWKTLELGKSCGTVQGKFRTPGAGSRACPLSLLSLLQSRARKFRKRVWMPQMLASDIQSRCFYFFFFMSCQACACLRVLVIGPLGQKAWWGLCTLKYRWRKFYKLDNFKIENIMIIIKIAFICLLHKCPVFTTC